MNDGTVEKCKRNGWKAGTRLVGNEGYGPTVIRITAVGEESILARQVSHNGKPTEDAWEGTWTLMARKWRRIRRGD
jgi:hypothetical protein